MSFYKITFQLRDQKREHDYINIEEEYNIEENYNIEVVFNIMRSKAISYYGQGNVVNFDCVHISKQSAAYKSYLAKKKLNEYKGLEQDELSSRPPLRQDAISH